jgi:peptidoglycan hydrolase-like protein with peptidoglycan-binding domain
MLDAETSSAKDDQRPVDPPPEADQTPDEPAPRPRRRRRGVLLGSVAVLAIGAGAGWYLTQRNQTTTPTTTTNLATAPVVRTDLTKTFDIDGTLGYGASINVLGGAAGRITWLPQPGDVIERGDRAYGVNGKSIPLFYGNAPLWRTLDTSVANGADVLLLERNLKALGYAGDMTVDRDFTYATAQAVKRWQKALGKTRTGAVGPDDALYTASDTRKVVTVEVPVNEAQGVAREGATVRVELPGGKKVSGKILNVGTVATSASGTGAQTGQGTETATVPVTITLGAKSSQGTLDGAPVTVGFSSTEHKGVLAVPINALLATTDTQYAVRVVDAAGTARTVPVKLGIFDGDQVEVTGELSEGTKVQVPPS